MRSKRSCRKRKSPGSLESEQSSRKKIQTRNLGKQDHLDQALRFCEKVMKETSSEDYLTLLRYLHEYGTGNITMVDLKTKIADYFPSFMDDFIRVLEFYDREKENLGKKKPQEIDDGVLTESYQFLPEEVQGIHSSGATELAKQVLNSLCYCQRSSGSSARRMSPTENMMNEREDMLYAIDMWKAWLHSTRVNATKLDRAIRDGVIKNPTAIHVNGHFTGYNFRFIIRMYGKDGWWMVDRLRDMPQAVLPVLIRRLVRMEIETVPLWTLD